MIPGVSGSLLSHEVIAQIVPTAFQGLLDEAGREPARHRLRAWHLTLRGQLGPALALRAIFDRLAEPLLTALGYRVVPANATPESFRAVLEVSGTPRATLLVTLWGQHPASAWREAVRLGIGQGERWCFCLTGPRLRIVDSSRTYSRQFVEFDLETALENEQTFAVVWGLLRGAAMAGTSRDTRPLLDRAIELSEQHRASVRTSLQHGVHDALGHLTRAFSAAGRQRRATAARRDASASRTPVSAFDEALVVVYRVLFLLFAEARGLVPRWHPTYRDSYTIESLRGPVEMLPRPVGVWEALQAIARLAHRGCRIGALRVPPFNGRLFSPAHAPLADSVPLDDRVVAPGPAGVDDPARTRRIRAHRLRRSRCRAARRRVRTSAGFRPGWRVRPGGHCRQPRPHRAPQGDGRLLYAPADHGVSRAARAGAARRHRVTGGDTCAAYPGPRHGQRGIPGGRVPVPGVGV